MDQLITKVQLNPTDTMSLEVKSKCLSVRTEAATSVTYRETSTVIWLISAWNHFEKTIFKDFF